MRNKILMSLVSGGNFVKKILDTILSTVLITIMGLMTLLVTYQVITRYIFESPSAISEVLSRYLFIWLILYGSAYVFGLREHMAISFVKDKFSRKLRIVIEMIIELFTVIFALTVMVIGGYNSAVRQMWQMDSALQIPMGVIYAAIPISGAIMVFYFFYNEIRLLQQLVCGEQETISNKGGN